MWRHVTLCDAVQHNKNGNRLHHRWTIGKPYGQSPKRYNVTLMWRSKWRHYNVTVTTLWRHCDAKRDASLTSAWRTKMRFLRIEEWIPKVVFQPHSKKKDLDRQFEADGQSINRFTFCPFALSLSLTHTHTHTHSLCVCICLSVSQSRQTVGPPAQFFPSNLTTSPSAKDSSSISFSLEINFSQKIINFYSKCWKPPLLKTWPSKGWIYHWHLWLKPLWWRHVS